MRMTEALAARGAATSRKWRVVMANPHAERIALANIKRLGFEAYLPMAITERPPTARRPAAQIIRPFLPGYLFARFDTVSDDWGDLFRTVGIKAVMMAGGSPVSVGDAQIAAMRQREEAGLIKISDPSDVVTWRKGQALRLVGNKTDIDVIFDELIDKNRAVVFVTLLGRTSRQVVTPLLLK